MKVNISATSEIANALMSTQVRMKKEDKPLYGRDTTELTKDGRWFTLTKPRKNKLQASTRNSVSILADHSILFPDYP